MTYAPSQDAIEAAAKANAEFDGYGPLESLPPPNRDHCCERARLSLIAAARIQAVTTDKDLAHDVLGGFCACYAEAYPGVTCDTERDELASFFAVRRTTAKIEDRVDYQPTSDQVDVGYRALSDFFNGETREEDRILVTKILTAVFAENQVKTTNPIA